MSRATIGIDGYNLAMPNGTGIATYGMTLAAILGDAGHPLTGIFGIDAGHEAAMREILFFERFGHGASTNPTHLIRQRRRIWRKALRPWLSLRAVNVPQTARVDRHAFAERLPTFDRLTTTPDLFATAYRHFRTYGRFMPLMMADPPAIMHWTYPVPIRLRGAANIYTIHDLVPLRLPYTTLDAKRAHRQLLLGCIANGHICTVSESSRADIIAEFGVDDAGVSNTYQAAPVKNALAVDAMQDAAAIENIFGLGHRRYFLYFGAIEPKKNIGRLIEAYLSTGSTTPLVMVGGRDWRSADELKLLPSGDEEHTPHGEAMARRVRRLDHLPRPLLLSLIRNARAVLFPSIYEGFGLPVLEAMQLGTPVLTSTVSSLPEIAGEAAVTVDPYDVGAIASGIRRIDSDAELRALLSAAGPVSAARFSSAHYLGRLEAMYERVLGPLPAST